MKKLFAALLVSLPVAIFALPATAADTAAPAKKELSAPQKKMIECNAKAKGLKGDDFKKTRDTCLKGEEAAAPAAAAAAPAAPAKKMTLGECSTKNKGLKGDEFKKAQADCMKG